MRNLLEYPLAAEEAASICDRVSNEYALEGRVGDMRAYALDMVAAFLRENIKEFEEFARIKTWDEVDKTKES